MATVTKNQDDTYTVTLTAKEQKTLKRWSEEPMPGSESRTKAAQLERLIHGELKLKAEAHQSVDGPKLREKYDAATDEQRAEVDAILNGAQ